MSTVDDLDHVVEQYHWALGEFMKGEYEPAKRLFSEREDVTLGNPFGPYESGSLSYELREVGMTFLGLHWDQGQGMFVQQPLLLGRQRTAELTQLLA